MGAKTMSVGPLQDLNIILTGLSTLQGETTVAGQNIANAATSGYAQQTADTSPLQGSPVPMASGTVGPGSFGGGVEITDIARQAPAYLSATARRAFAQKAYASTWSTVLKNAEAVYQEPSSVGLSASMGQFFNDLTVLSQDPSNLGAKSVVVADAQTLAQKFNNLAQGLNQSATSAQNQLADVVGQDNNLLTQVAQLNGAIMKAQMGGESPNALLDQRSVLLDQLSKDLGATVTPFAVTGTQGPLDLPNGMPLETIQVTLPNGSVVVQGASAGSLAIGTGTPVSVQATAVGASGPSTVQWPANQGGTAGALVALLTGPLSGDGSGSSSQSWLNQLDQVAASLASQVNALQTTGYAPDPSTGAMTVQTQNPLFQPSSGTGSITAGTLAVNPTLVQNPMLVAAAQSTSPNDGSNAQAMASLGTESTGPLAVYQSQVSSIGTAVQAAGQMATIQSALSAQAEQARQSVSGVNINEEVAHLAFDSQAYAALAKTLGTLQTMMSVLVNAVQ